MSEKMTDERFAFMAQQGYFDRSDIRAIFAEAKRARASEAEKDKALQEKDAEIERLTRERDALAASRRSIMETVNAKESRIQEKDAQIKALADALNDVRRAARDRGLDWRVRITPQQTDAVEAALRLVGRI